MKDPIYRLIELTGTSTTSVEEAMVEVIRRARDTVKSMCWFEMGEPHREIIPGRLDRWQVTLRVGFTV
jgi:hypothetical protein